jgi:hypothetical protein
MAVAYPDNYRIDTAWVYGGSAYHSGRAASKQDLAAAKASLAKSGYKGEKLTFIVHNDRPSVDTATVIQGIGTMGSRSVPMVGSATKVASQRLLVRAKKIAAHLLEAAEEDLEVADDAFSVKGSPGKKVGWSDVALASFQPLRLPPELQAGTLEERLFQESPNFSYPSGAYGCVVEIDRRTGKVKVAKLDVDNNQRTAARFNVRSIPTILFFKGGVLVDQVVGAVPRPALEAKFKEHA